MNPRILAIVLILVLGKCMGTGKVEVNPDVGDPDPTPSRQYTIEVYLREIGR